MYKEKFAANKEIPVRESCAETDWLKIIGSYSVQYLYLYALREKMQSLFLNLN